MADKAPIALTRLTKDVDGLIREGEKFSQNPLDRDQCKPLEEWYNACQQLDRQLATESSTADKSTSKTLSNQLEGADIPDPEFPSDAKRIIREILAILYDIKALLDERKPVK
jgi:hypothetical protein